MWSYGGGLNIYFDGGGLFTIASAQQDIHTFAGHTVFWRPLTNIFYRLLYAGFWLNPLPYHIMDLIIHGLNTLLVYHITMKLSKDSVVALVAGLMFAAFFLHANLLFPSGLFYEHGCAFFCLVAIATFLHFQDTSKKGYLAVSLSSILIALLLKESALVALPLILALDQFYRPHPLPRIRWGLILCLAGIGVIYIGSRIHFMPNSAGGMPGWLDPIKNLGVINMLKQINRVLHLAISNVCPDEAISDVFYMGFMLFIWKVTRHRRLTATAGILVIISVLPCFFTIGLLSRYVYFPSALSVIFLAIIIRHSASALARRIIPSFGDIGVGLVTGAVLVLIVSFNIQKIHELEVVHRAAGDLLRTNIEDIKATFPNGTRDFRLCLINSPTSLLYSRRGGIQVRGDNLVANWVLPLFYEEPNSIGEVTQLAADLGYPITKYQEIISSKKISDEELDSVSQDPKNRIMVFNPYTGHLEHMTGKTSQEIRTAIENTRRESIF